MRKKRLLWQLYPPYLLIILVSLTAVGWFASYSLEEIALATVRNGLRVQAEALDQQIGANFSADQTPRLRELCAASARLTSSRITLILPSGEVICDSEKPGPLENHAGRPEIQRALAGELGTSIRFSETVRRELLYVALPVLREGRVVGVVRVSVPLTSIADDVRRFQLTVATGGLCIAVLAAAVSLVVARRLSRPLEEMRIGAARFAQGDLNYKLHVPESEEMAGLAETLNDMAQQLEERISTVMRQSSEQQAVLASMVEGVLAVDTDQRLISLNRAAADLLHCVRADPAGRSLQEVVRNADLRRFVSQALAAVRPIEGDIIMHGDPDRVLQAHGTALRDSRGRAIGAVIVLNDVTSFRQLENMRRDFVANVSHELKTPITSIKGFVETLLDGALQDSDDAERFLRIIAKQADRLNAIIEDLLRLSKIEQSEEGSDIVLERARVREVLESAVHDCQPAAIERQVAIRLECDDRVEARLNSPLLEQAVVNLLDNAIKYSESGGEVQVRAEGVNGSVLITVRDDGCGIPAEHLSRIFERFYRVDKARSRKLGGTGLGLAIVKHIVNVHHGRVSVESTPGKGSTFSIRLPH
jgi:two-component system, OmpR family, phosphate regulon sensor histidine kinase PhoR